MRKRLFILLFGSLQFLSVLPAYGQSPVGKWVDSNQNVTLILRSDFTYSLTYPNGSSTGAWSSGGNQFCLRDAFASAPVCYHVIAYSATVLDLRDVNGAMLNYRKVTGQTPGVPVISTPAGKKRIKGGERVIAVQGNHKLTYGNLSTAIDLIQFIIGHKVKDNELRDLKSRLEEEFNAQPILVLKEINEIASAMEKVYRSTDPLKIGMVRQELFAAFYKATRHLDAAQVPLMIQVIKRYIKVLAYDERNNLVLTNRDVEGYLNYLIFNSELLGQKVDANYAVRKDITAYLITNFNSMPLNQKQLLASSSLIWQLFESNWNRLTNDQKTTYMNAYRNQISSRFNQNRQGAGSGQNWTPPAGSQKKNIDQMRREYNAKQNMFTMMQNMNTNSHALSLNIIENIGGTGNYWNVVDY